MTDVSLNWYILQLQAHVVQKGYLMNSMQECVGGIYRGGGGGLLVELKVGDPPGSLA